MGAFTPKDVEDEIERSELLKAQEKLSKKAKKDKASKDAAVKAEADAKRQRKEGDGFFFPDLHRIRQEEREAARKRQGAADAKAQAVADAIVQRELVKKAKMDELREAAIKAEMLRDAPPGITKEEIERQRAQAKIDDERSFEARRAIVNAERALKGLPPFPPRKPLDEAATRKAIDDQREAAEERRARDAERAEEQRLAREKQRAKKAEHDRKDREAARVAVKLAADRNKNPERKGC